LSDLAIELLDQIKTLSSNSKWAFPSPTSDSHVAPLSLSRALNRSTFEKLEPLTPHDLRRTGATLMTAIGIPRLVVSKILNHVDSSITSIYDRHSYDSEKKQALEAWGRKLKQLIYSSESEDNIIDIGSINTKKQVAV
jgi:integrase